MISKGKLYLILFLKLVVEEQLITTLSGKTVCICIEFIRLYKFAICPLYAGMATPIFIYLYKLNHLNKFNNELHNITFLNLLNHNYH